MTMSFTGPQVRILLPGSFLQVPWSTSSQFTAHPRALPLMAPSLPLPPELVALSSYAGVLAPHQQVRMFTLYDELLQPVKDLFDWSRKGRTGVP
jgi:hypothetical protein